MNAHIGEDGTEQFTVTTRVNDEKIGEVKVHDPFIHTTVKLRGLKHAWNALFRGITVAVHTGGSEGASRAIMTLDPRKLQAETDQILFERAESRERHVRGEYGKGLSASDTSLRSHRPVSGIAGQGA